MIEWNSSQKTTSFRDPEIGKFDKKNPIKLVVCIISWSQSLHTVKSSRPVYYSILDPFDQISPS